MTGPAGARVDPPPRSEATLISRERPSETNDISTACDLVVVSPQFFPFRLGRKKQRRWMKSVVAAFRRQFRNHATKLVYRVAGLPIAIRALRCPPQHNPGKLVRSAYRTRYWTAHSPGDLLELLAALVLAPIVVVGMIVWFTSRNGRNVRGSAKRSVVAQLGDQVWLYVKAGVLPPWYYIYELHRHPVKREARSFIQRCECKNGVPGCLRK